MSHSGHTDTPLDAKARLRQQVHHLEHVLPGQAPIKDFVHHNTLHGYQHLPFSQAVAEARRLTGARGYLPAERFREFFAAGRINLDDLEASLNARPELDPDAAVARAADGPVSRRQVLLTALLHPFKRLSRGQLKWQVEEMGALTRFQDDVPEAARKAVLTASGAPPAPAIPRELGREQAAIADLWAACLEVLGLEHAARHPEELLDPSPEQAEALAERIAADSGLSIAAVREEGLASRYLAKEAHDLLDQLLARVGGEWTLRGLLLALTGEDVLDTLRPQLIRHFGAHLDQGLAAWHSPARAEGFYAAWRRMADRDPVWLLDDLAEWEQLVERLPDDPLDTLLLELRLTGLPEDRWPGYLERLALQLPGWSGMALWRSGHPGYTGLTTPVDMLDYLAVYLVLERVHAQRLCRRHWRIEASLDGLKWHFHHQPAELLVRHALYDGRLPEYLVDFAERLARDNLHHPGSVRDEDWQQVAQLIWSWRQTPAADRQGRVSVAGDGWRLFRLAQHLGIAGPDMRAQGRAGADALLAVLTELDEDAGGQIWLEAYERHYREGIFAALAANHGRWRQQPEPEAQLVFCMDDREEGIRRHLEELNPYIETLGAAAHFNVPHNWRGLDDTGVTALAPVIPAPVIPAHEVCETHRPEFAALHTEHDQRHAKRARWRETLSQGSRLGLIRPALLAAAAAPASLALLAGKVLAPGRAGAYVEGLAEAYDRPVPSRITFTAPNDSPAATPEAPRLGFTDVEQADRVQALLTNIGLLGGFAPLVVIAGHGSRNQNNPHASAYNCGACSGRFSGPNARLVSAMANRPEVRAILAGRGIAIPDSTWFVGAEHDTCDDRMLWYDLDLVPGRLTPLMDKIQAQLEEAGRAHAKERCRRLASAPLDITADDAWRHVSGRRYDFSQARPELGHATNACAFIGRRQLSRGAFFDRRAFLISYDPTLDPDGTVLERHLLINGAVGAGISLEYYFSTADNEGYGSGSKVMHNVTGYLGVMEGAGSDLRTGLPRQMIEIHEAMRLLVVIEHSLGVITAIYQRQLPIQELVGGGWVTVAAKDPDSAAIHLFDPARGWVLWEGGAAVPTVDKSEDWFAGHREPLAPVLLEKPVRVAG
ncbi:MAG TPA: DUF2309 domain-containing protein [Thiobacillaceae bacterium]|nr:DUF2309 domain-containing protein [Thiobacillaceae bacterium]